MRTPPFIRVTEMSFAIRAFVHLNIRTPEAFARLRARHGMPPL